MQRFDGKAAPSRRSFLTGASAVGFSLAIGLDGLISPVMAADPFGPPQPTDLSSVMSAWLTVGADGIITLVSPEAEMGQGSSTALAQLFAEEFEVAWDKVQVRQMTAAPAYANPIFGMSTGASMSIRGRYIQMRELGAAARMMMLSAAAEQWKVLPSACAAKDGRIVCGTRSLSYGELAQAASRQPAPTRVTLKPRSEWQILGKSVKRVDMTDKCRGAARYGYDGQVPGMAFAAVVHSPVFGGKLKSFDDKIARARKGVIDVLPFGDWIACVADNSWSALQGAQELSVIWDEGDFATVNDAAIRTKATAIIDIGVLAKTSGDAAKAMLSPTGKTLKAEYFTPYLDHMCMEPTSAIASLSDGKLEIWSGTQSPRAIYLAAKLMLGLSEDRVLVHQALIGSSFGRRGYVDAEVQAIALTRKLGRPIKVLRPRAEDIQHGFYRPAHLSKVEGVVDGGRLMAWKQNNAGQSILDNYARYFSLGGVTAEALARETGPAGPSRFNYAPYDFMSVDGSPFDGVYEIPNQEIRSAKLDLPIPVGMFRGVGQTNNIFAVESFIDEAAHLAGKDPLDFRLAMLNQQPRFANALRRAAEVVGWGKKTPGRGLGIAVCGLSESASVAIADVSVKNGELRLNRFVCVVDIGIVLNPDIVKAQVQGGLLLGLGAALWGRVSIDRGRVEQSNYHDYPVMTHQYAPKIEVILVESNDQPTTISESITPLAAPALCNAIFAASGMRLRDLPVIGDRLKMV